MSRFQRTAICQNCHRVYNYRKAGAVNGRELKGARNKGMLESDIKYSVVNKLADLDDVTDNPTVGNVDTENAMEREGEATQDGSREDNQQGLIEGDIELEIGSSTSVGEDEEEEVRRKIRVGAWNAEGLFEKLGLNGVCEYISTLDIACLGETFTFSSFDFNIKFGDYLALHSPAKKFNIRGRPSGGLVVLVKKTLERFVTIIDTKISHVLCFKLAKEYLNTVKDILFIGTYVHPVDSVFYTDEDHDCTLEAIKQFMLDQLEEDEEYSYVLAGDLNAKIGDWGLRVGEVEADLDEEDTEVIDRNSQDGVVNENGQKLIQICTAFNTTPLSGIRNKGHDDHFTFIGRRGNSTIDHFVCSADILDNVVSYSTVQKIG